MLLKDAKAVLNPETPLAEVDLAGVRVRLTRNVENTKAVFLGSSCSTAVELRPRKKEAMGSIPARHCFFPPPILSNVSLNRSLKEVHHNCFSY